MNIRRAAVTALITLANVVAAGAFATAPAAAATTNPCALITAAEASAAMHVHALPGIARPGRDGASCRYYSPNHQMNVFVKAPLSGGDMIGAGQFGGKPVSGVGDKAIWAGGTLFVQKGRNVASVALYLSPASMNKMDPALVTLGKIAAGRM